MTTMSLRIDSDRTTLSGSEAVVAVAPGWERLAREYFGSGWPPLPGDIENAIASIEDELMRVPRSLRGSEVSSDDPALREVARAAGVPDTARLARDIVERTFERLAAVAQGRPNSLEHLPEQPRFTASLLILRELQHHLDIPSITLVDAAPHQAAGSARVE